MGTDTDHCPRVQRADLWVRVRTIVGGYLGAGKTTLLNALLAAVEGVRLAVVVNDFGRINIDAALIASRDGDTISLANGCVCCTIVDGLVRTLYDLAARPDRLDHILIEASGVADPRKVARSSLIHPRLRLDGVVVVADAADIRTRATDPHVGDLVRRQLAVADVVVLSKTDLLDPAERAAGRAWLDGEVPAARVVETRGGCIAPEILLGVGSAQRLGPDMSPAADDTARFGTWSFTADRPFDGARLRARLADLPPAVIRAEGVLFLAEDPERRFVLQVVGRRWSLAPDAPWGEAPRQSALVVIGLAGTLDAQQLEAMFGEAVTGG